MKAKSSTASSIECAVPGLAMNISFAEGIRETISHVLSHKECQTDAPEFDAWCDKVIDAHEAVKKRFV